MTDTDDLRLRSQRFFPGQQLTAQSLNRSADTERHRRWLHNRLLHGYGISFGLEVTRGEGDTTVVVGPGHAIDTDGRDLVVAAPRTVQVPPVPSDEFDLVCEWSDATRETGTGPCDATGETVRHEDPLVRFVAQGTGHGVVLATASVDGCRLTSLVFDARQSLAGAPVPFVNAGRYVPRPGDWAVFTQPVSGTPVPVGLRITVDTSDAGFFGNVAYTARIMGPRWMPAWNHVLCLDPFVVDARATSFDLGVIVLADGILSQLFTPVTLATFMTAASITTATRIPELLGWTVAWMGVEGTT